VIPEIFRQIPRITGAGKAAAMDNPPATTTDKPLPKFGMFTGVFVPTLLSIIDVIMYLRFGWVVGSVGLLGAWAIIVLAFIITTTTALSMSSIISNIRIGSGGAYSIISRSLGLEIGGSIGVPLYLAFVLSVALCIFGFREGIQFIFPQVPSLPLDIITLGILFCLVLISTDLMFRIQFPILAIVIISLFSVFAAGIPALPAFSFTGQPDGESFWIVFAVFFPAATGILAGANMSGELKKPRWSIPVGTLAAIGVSFVIYLGVSYWLAANAPPGELVSDLTFLLDNGRYDHFVLAGLIAAAFSTALNSLAGASRILHAMGEQNILPGSAWLAKRSARGIPQNALLVTLIITIFALMLRELNTIAPIITLFFLITYGMMNIVVLVEDRLSLVSFRPLFKVPAIVPAIGTLGCIFAMFIINPAFGLMAVILIVVFYNILMSRHLSATSLDGDVRSSLFVAIAEWAAKKSTSLPRARKTAWKPNMLIPVLAPAGLRGISEFIRDITFPSGSVRILGINRKNDAGRFADRLPELSREFEEEGIFARWTVIDAENFADATIASIQVLKGSFFPPNIVFLRMPDDPGREQDVLSVIPRASANQMGVLLYAPHPEAGLGRHHAINLRLAQPCTSWSPGPGSPNCNLSMLVAYKLKVNWDATLNVIAPSGGQDREKVQHSLQDLLERARIPVSRIIIVPGESEMDPYEAPLADLEIFSLPENPDPAEIRAAVSRTRSSCIFCRDSTLESVLV